MAQHSPQISIALPAYNAERTIDAAVVSLRAQQCDDWELLVMDDGSTDATLDAVRRFGDPRIRVVADGIHRGLPSQLNRAVDIARGKYIARMDADDIAYPIRFCRQLEFLDSHPDVDLVAGWVAVFKSDGTMVGVRRGPTAHEDICARPWRGIPMAHPTWMGRIEWFKANRYPDGAIRMEDRELLLRTYRQSRFAVIPEILLAYREDSLSLRKQLLARRNTCKAAARLGKEEGRVISAGSIILGQCVRAATEALALSTGLGYRVLRGRAMPARPEEESAFKAIWAHNSEVCLALRRRPGSRP